MFLYVDLAHTFVHLKYFYFKNTSSELLHFSSNTDYSLELQVKMLVYYATEIGSLSKVSNFDFSDIQVYYNHIEAQVSNRLVPLSICDSCHGDY
jgi:hypothetical protein